MILNLTEEFLIINHFFHWLHLNVIRRMTSTFKMLIKESINLFRFFNFTIVLTKSFLQLATSLSNILHITVLSVSS